MQKKKHTVDILFLVCLFCVFALSSLLVLVFGANSHQKNVEAAQKNYNQRTSLLYLAEKVRQNDVRGAVRLGKVGESDALVMETQIEGSAYETWIFLNEGELREVMVRGGSAVNPTDGQPIMALSDLDLELTDGFLTICVTDEEQNTSQLTLVLRCAEKRGGVE